MRGLLNLLGVLLYPIFKWLDRRPHPCPHCKEAMEVRDQPRLFLIPVNSDHDYTESAAYYLKNCVLIGSEDEIPTGQRACRFWELHCPGCGHRYVRVDDFLKVRDTEVLEKCNTYDAQELRDLLHSSGR